MPRLGLPPALPIASLVLTLATPAFAQTAPALRSIGLRDAIALAVKQNRTIRATDADIEIAAANEEAALGFEDFILSANAGWRSNRSGPVEGTVFQQTELDNLHTDVTAAQPFGYGGRLGLTFSHDYTRTTIHSEAVAGMAVDRTTDSFSPTVQLTYFQPILKGFGTDVNRAARRRAAAASDVATLDLENTASTVVRDAIQAYWELVYAEKDLEIRRSALALAREQLRVTQARLDVGVGAPTDLAEVKQTIATREEDVLLSELTYSERALDLRQLAGMEISPTEIGLRPTDETMPKSGDLSIQQGIEMAYQHNPQLAALQGRGRAAAIEVEVNENGLLPQLDLNANVGPSGTSSDFGSALNRMVTFKDYQVGASVAFSMPIARHAAKGAVAAARGQVHKIQITEEDLRSQIAVAVARGVDLVTSTKKRLDVDAEAIQLAQVNLDAERARFDVGRSTNFEVLRRQDELAQAQLRRVRATADYAKAVATLQTVTGELLSGYGIVIKSKTAR